jgi:hypothetical protein
MERELLRAAPASERACRWQYDLTHALASIATTKRADQVKEVEALVAVYVANKDRVAGEELREGRDNAAAMAGELARAYHVEAVTTTVPRLVDADGCAHTSARSRCRGSRVGERRLCRLLWCAPIANRTRRLGPRGSASPKRSPPPAHTRAPAAGIWPGNAMDLDRSSGTIDLLKSARGRASRHRRSARITRWRRWITWRRARRGDAELQLRLVEAALYRQYLPRRRSGHAAAASRRPRDHEQVSSRELAARLLVRAPVRRLLASSTSSPPTSSSPQTEARDQYQRSARARSAP